MTLTNWKDKKSTEILFFVICIETFLGGGGDLFSFHLGPMRLTLRMVLFVVLMLRLIIIDRKIAGFLTTIPYIIMALLGFCLISFCIGAIRYSVASAFDNLLTVVYLMAIFPLNNLSRLKKSSFETVGPILCVCSLIISVISIIIYFVCNTGISDAYSLRIILQNISADALLRNNGGFVYAGHLYVLVAAIYIIIKGLFDRFTIIRIILILLYSAALFLSTTRGLIYVYFLSLALVLLIAIVKGNKHKGRKLIILLIGFLIGARFIGSIDFSRVTNINDFSVTMRMDVLNRNIQEWLRHPVFGTGYGMVFSGREWSNSFEISLLDILIKQGLVGIVLWLSYFFMCIREIKCNYIQMYTSFDEFLFSVISIVAMFLVSFTNPYFNNSVGMFLVFIILAQNTNRRLYKNESNWSCGSNI